MFNWNCKNNRAVTARVGRKLSNVATLVVEQLEDRVVLANPISAEALVEVLRAHRGTPEQLLRQIQWMAAVLYGRWRALRASLATGRG